MTEPIPYIAHESAMVRLERTNMRIWILCIVLIIALVGTNAGWFYYESQFERFETTIDATQDGNGTNIVSGGDLEYGAESQGNN